MTPFKKIIIIKSDNQEEESFLPPRKPSLKETLKRIFLTIFSLILIAAIFYLAIVASIFLILIFLVFAIIASIAVKFKKKRKYYKMN